MYKLWQKDGLSRKRRIENAKFNGNLRLLNDDLYALSQKANDFASFINFYKLSNKVDGTFNQVIDKSVFLTLTGIRKINVETEEKDFLLQFENDFYTHHVKQEKLIENLLRLTSLFNSWLKNTSYFEAYNFKLAFRSDLVNQVVTNLRSPIADLFDYCKQHHSEIDLPELSGIWKTKERTNEIKQSSKFFKSTFYKLINSMKALQDNVELYEKEIWESGYNDPAIGLLAAFFVNQKQLVERFNERWQQYSKFYLDQILLAVPAKPIPDYTYLKIVKQPLVKYLDIPEGTLFQTDDEIKFSNLYGFIANSVSLKKVVSLFEEKDHEIEPANELGYVTALQKNDLSALIDQPVSRENRSKSVFGNKGKKSTQAPSAYTNYTSVGLMINSWSFLMREGERELNLKFTPTESSLQGFTELIKSICEKWAITEHETIYKLLNDVFYIEISTEEGWRKVDSSSVQMILESAESYFNIDLHFDESFPPVCPIANEDEKTILPVVRILINRDTWLFPYSWLKVFECSRIKIESRVKELSNILVYSELGRLDNTLPFYPFGVMPKKGSWLAFGSYEMALKTIKNMNLHIRWSDLPDDDYGFAGYYAQYEKGIDNCSFEVKAETLKNRKWVPINSDLKKYLFSTDASNGEFSTAPNAKLIEESCLKNIKLTEFLSSEVEEEEYKFNMFTRNGFFRLVLYNPAMGFGHHQFQKLLSDVMMQKARSKKMVQTPNTPFSPQIEQITIDYVSEDEITLGVSKSGNNEVFHIHPFGLKLLNNSSNSHNFHFIPDFTSRGNLLFGFDKVEGGETVRLFVDMLPQNKEIDKSDFPEIKWFYGDGYQWQVLPPNQIIVDETRKLLETGNIEIRLPGDIPNLEFSMDKLFWLRASIEKNTKNVSEVLGFYLHVIKVERVISKDGTSSQKFEQIPALSISKPEKKIPGLDEIIQLKNTSGGRLPETDELMKVRLAERIAHRNRAVSALDYEKIVLENFPKVRKVKCFPGTDSKSNRPGVVTLAVIEQDQQESALKTPKSNCKLLLDIEDFLKNYTSIFTTIDAINPEYEFLQVRCKVSLRETQSEGFYLRKLNAEINDYIAFWEKENQAPVFGHSVSIIELANFIRSREYITHIANFSLVHLREKHEFHYELKELEEFETTKKDDSKLRTSIKILLNNQEIEMSELKPIRASKPWAILIPSEKHMLVAGWENQNDHAGIDELEIGNTFVIK